MRTHVKYDRPLPYPLMPGLSRAGFGSLLLLAAAIALQSPPDPAAAAPVSRPSAHYTETLAQKVVCIREGGVWSCGEVTTGQFKLTAHLPMDEVDYDTINQTTPFLIRINEVKFNEALGNSGNYRDGDNRAQFAVQDPGPGAYGRTRILYVTLYWTRARLDVEFSGKIPEYVDGLLTLPFAGLPTSSVSSDALVTIRFADTTWLFDVTAKGRVVSRPVIRGADAFVRSNVRLSGRGVYRGPG